MTLLARQAAALAARALVATALAICQRSKLHTAVMVLADALTVLSEGDDCE